MANRRSVLNDRFEQGAVAREAYRDAIAIRRGGAGPHRRCELSEGRRRVALGATSRAAASRVAAPSQRLPAGAARGSAESAELLGGQDAADAQFRHGAQCGRRRPALRPLRARAARRAASIGVVGVDGLVERAAGLVQALARGAAIRLVLPPNVANLPDLFGRQVKTPEVDASRRHSDAVSAPLPAAAGASSLWAAPAGAEKASTRARAGAPREHGRRLSGQESSSFLHHLAECCRLSWPLAQDHKDPAAPRLRRARRETRRLFGRSWRAGPAARGERFVDRQGSRAIRCLRLVRRDRERCCRLACRTLRV